jgi:hypothetical protein
VLRKTNRRKSSFGWNVVYRAQDFTKTKGCCYQYFATNLIFS